MYCDSSKGGCGHAMCWLCCGDWDSTHNDHFKCNKYNTQVLENKLEGYARTAHEAELRDQRMKDAEKRYKWHSERQFFFEAAADDARNRLKDKCESDPCENFKRRTLL